MLKRISSILHPCGGFRFNLLLGWLWLHEVGALASSLHKKAKAFFLLGKTVVDMPSGPDYNIPILQYKNLLEGADATVKKDSLLSVL